MEYGKVAMTGPVGGPPAGTIDALFNSNAPLSQMLIDSLTESTGGMPFNPTGMDDEENDNFEDDTEIDMNNMATQMANSLGISPQGDSLAEDNSQTSDISSDNDDNDYNNSEYTEDYASEYNGEEDSGLFKKINLKFLLIGVGALLAILVIIVVVRKAANTSSLVKTTAETPAVAQTSDSIKRFSNDTLVPTDGLIYEDSMTIDKYIEIDKDCCLYVFKGFAENARAFVKAYVSLDEYNTYKVGARIPILYKRITIEGTDYYMEVRLNTNA